MAEQPDRELDELLESAAKDFKKSEDPQDEQSRLQCKELFDQAQADFLGSDLAKEIEQKMKEGFAAAFDGQSINPDELQNQLKGLNLFGDINVPDGDKEKEFSDAIMGAMQSLKDNLSGAFPAAREGEDGDGEDAAGGEMENLTSVMQQMMLSLLSKEMLLPPFKEMSEKYPGWLEENKSKLSEADFKRYTEQLEVVKQIVAELEKEGTEDDKQHLDRMIELMGKAQELGQPPQELTALLGNTIDDTKIDAMLKSSGADECSIM